MPQLRWILLAVGVVFCVALWWWETRRRGHRTQALRRVEAFRSLESSSEVNLARDRDYPDDVPHDDPHDDLHDHAGADLLDGADDSADDLDDLPHESSAAERPVVRRIEPTFESGSAEFAAGRAEPTFESESQPELQDASHSAPIATPAHREQQQEQKIVSLRLVAGPERSFGGRDLREALQGAGLLHGKFSIFHRQTADGAVLFSVASLTEPGSFDLQTMDRQQFRGVTFFAVLADAGEEGMDEMHQTAQGIATRLHGTLSGGR